MTDDSEITLFFERVAHCLKLLSDDDDLSGIVYIGDPNKTKCKLTRTLEETLMQKFGLSNLIGNIPTRITRLGTGTQPDSCYARFDCSKLTISASVIGKILGGPKGMDHRAIRLNFAVRGTVPKLPDFKEVRYTKRNKNVTDAALGKFMNKLLSVWLHKYQPIVYDREGKVRSAEYRVSGDLVERATDEFLHAINEIKNYGWTTQVAKWPVNTPADSDNLTVQISQLESKMSHLCL